MSITGIRYPLFPRRFRMLIDREKTTKAAIAVKTGLSEAALSRWEAGLRDPKDVSLRVLCEVLHCEMSDLVGDCGVNVTVVGDVTVGFGTRIGHYCVIDGTGAPITIGENCVIENMVQILTRSPRDPDLTAAGKIGHTCIIGTGSILFGVNLSDGRNVPPGTLLAEPVEGSRKNVFVVPKRRTSKNLRAVGGGRKPDGDPEGNK